MEQLQQQIIEASKMCLSGDKQLMEKGQAFLRESILTPSFASVLMLLVDNEQLHMDERQFAITQLKSLVETKWRPSQKFQTLSETDKNDVKKNILEAMIRVSSQRKLYKTYDKIIFLIASQDFPNKWADIAGEINKKISESDDYNVLFGSLTTLCSLCQVFEYQIGDEDRKPLNDLVNLIFPNLIVLAQKLYQNYSVQTGVLMQLILKCFYKSINLEIPLYFSNFDLLKNWFELLKIILIYEVPQEYKQIYQKDSDIMAQNKISFWKNKKMVGKLLMRFAQKYSNQNYESAHTKGLSQFFLNNYSTLFVDLFIQILYGSQTQFVSMPTLHFSMRYIQMCLRIKQLIEYMTPKLTDLAIKVCIPTTALTNRDQQLFIQDPIEFMRKEEDFSQTMYNPKNAALDLIEIIAKQNDQKHLIELMQFFYQTLSTNILNEAPLTSQQKDGILWAFGELFPDIMKNQQLKQQIEPILQNFVLPLHNAPEPYLRSRVIWLYGVYGCIQYENQQTITDMTQIMCNGIIEDNLIIKTRSAIALNKFINQKIAREIVRTEVKKLIEFYLKLMEEVDSEDLVAALEGIIQNFGSEVKEFSIGLVQQLVEAFNRYDEKENEDGDDDAMYGEGEFAAAGCLNAINQILRNDLDPQVYQSLENIVYPVMTYSLTEESEYLEEGLDMIAIFFQRTNQISEQMYFLFVATSYMLSGISQEIDLDQIQVLNENQRHVLESVREGWGTEFCYKVLPIYKNVLQKSGNNFLTMTDFLNKTFVDLMFDVVENTIKQSIISEDDTDMTNILHYFLAFIENNLKNQQAYGVVERIINVTLKYLNANSKYKFFSRNCYIVICTAMMYNHELVIKTLESNNITQQFFEIMLNSFMKAKKPSQNTDLELQKVIMGLSQILTIPQQQLPQSIVNILPILMNTFSFLVEMILELRECDDSDDNQDDDDDDEDDDDFFEKVSYADKYETPLDDVDELIEFQEKLNQLKANNEAMFNELINLLSQDKQQKLDNNLKEAQKQYEEYKQNQQQK